MSQALKPAACVKDCGCSPTVHLDNCDMTVDLYNRRSVLSVSIFLDKYVVHVCSSVETQLFSALLLGTHTWSCWPWHRLVAGQLTERV